MRDAVFKFVLPTTRESGLPLAEEDIASVEVGLSVDATNFTVVADVVPPNLETPLIEQLDNGEWTVRMVVVDSEGTRGDPVDTPFISDDSAPGQVTNVEVILS